MEVTSAAKSMKKQIWPGFTISFFQAVHATPERPPYGLPRAGRARNLYRGIIPCVVSDLGMLIIAARILTGNCPSWLMCLYLLRLANPLLSIGLHCSDMDLLPLGLSPQNVYAIDCSWIAVATMTDLLYCSWGLGHSDVITNDLLILFAGAALCVCTRTIAKDFGLGLFLLRAVHLGLSCTDGVAWLCCAMAGLGCALNLVDEARPATSKDWFSVYDFVHICWFANFILMLWLGDQN